MFCCSSALDLRVLSVLALALVFLSYLMKCINVIQLVKLNLYLCNVFTHETSVT